VDGDPLTVQQVKHDLKYRRDQDALEARKAAAALAGV
jgi:hypothetical protein